LSTDNKTMAPNNQQQNLIDEERALLTRKKSLEKLFSDRIKQLEKERDRELQQIENRLNLIKINKQTTLNRDSSLS
jgi:hypothetical protein